MRHRQYSIGNRLSSAGRKVESSFGFVPTIDALQTADFDYDLPAELIAQNPLDRRDDSRLLVLDRSSGLIHHSTFSSVGDWLAPGDLFVANNSRVIPARLRGRRCGSGGRWRSSC